jgi:hypothetical protein
MPLRTNEGVIAMSLADANKKLKWDTRLTERSLTFGELSKEEWQKHLDQLPDLSNNVEKFTIDNKNHSSSSDETH